MNLQKYPIFYDKNSIHKSVINKGAFFIAKNVITNNEKPKFIYPTIIIAILVQSYSFLKNNLGSYNLAYFKLSQLCYDSQLAISTFLNQSKFGLVLIELKSDYGGDGNESVYAYELNDTIIMKFNITLVKNAIFSHNVL